MLENTKKYIKDVLGTRVENILYIFGIRDHWGTLERSPIF
jgi:hypothetical protein